MTREEKDRLELVKAETLASIAESLDGINMSLRTLKNIMWNK